MIERVVLIQLQPEYRGDDDRQAVAEHTREVLTGLPGVVGLKVATPADDRTRREWDLCIMVQFETLQAVESYRAHDVHRKYVDVYLRPMKAKIRALNFEA